MGLRRQAHRQHYVIRDVIERRAIVFKCITCSTFDDITDDVILLLGWGGSIFLGESQSCIYPNMTLCAKFGCGLTVVSKKRGGGVQTDRQRDPAASYSRLYLDQ